MYRTFLTRPRATSVVRMAVGRMVLGLVALCASAAQGGMVETSDGSRIVGTITKVTKDAVVVETSFAGTLTLTMAQVKSVDSPDPVTVKLSDNTQVTGAITLSPDGELEVRNDMLKMATTFDKVSAAWDPGTTPPKESGYEQPREWVYALGIDVTGREGNSQQRTINVTADATLVSDDDELYMYASIEKAQQQSQQTADEVIAGMAYTSYFNAPWGWYARGEVERDVFENLNIRTTLAGGLSYLLIARDIQRLEFLAGLGYRFQSFGDGTTTNAPTVEFGFDHHYQWRDWLTMNNRLTFSPQLSALDQYLIVHDSNFSMPIGSSDLMSLRFGVRNDYNSSPAVGRLNLDTSYYSRLLFNW